MATIASLVAEHVTLEVRSVDRILVAGHVPGLRSEGLLVRFVLDRGCTIPSPAALGRIGRAYMQAIERFAASNAIPVVRFAAGACKEDVARPYLEAAEREGRFGVVMIGVAREKLIAWKGYRHAARRRTRTSATGACRRSRTTTTSTCATPSGGRRWSRPSRTRRIRCGCA